MQWIKLVILLLFTFTCPSYANAQLSNLPWHATSRSYGIEYQHPLSLTPLKIGNSFPYIPNLLTNQPNTAPTWSFAPHYQQQLGFFCKIEHKLEYKTKFPVKFRLGEVNYVDVLEGKRNATFYQYVP